MVCFAKGFPDKGFHIKKHEKYTEIKVLEFPAFAGTGKIPWGEEKNHSEFFGIKIAF